MKHEHRASLGWLLRLTPCPRREEQSTALSSGAAMLAVLGAAPSHAQQFAQEQQGDIQIGSCGKALLR